MSSSNQPLLFVIVGRNEPLFETELIKRNSSSTTTNPSSSTTAIQSPPTISDAMIRQNYFILHSSLDLVDKAAWTTNQMYLKVIDKVNQQQVSCFLTAANIKFLLLHTGNKNDDIIRNFFQDVYELYVKVKLIYMMSKYL